MGGMRLNVWEPIKVTPTPWSCHHTASCPGLLTPQLYPFSEAHGCHRPAGTHSPGASLTSLFLQQRVQAGVSGCQETNTPLATHLPNRY